MTSTYIVPQAALHDPDHKPSPHQSVTSNPRQTSTDATHLSPDQSDTLSPTLNFETPAGSNSTLSHYQSSDFSDLDEDPFFGADFNTIEGGAPSFLDDHTVGLNQALFAATPSSGTGLGYNDDGNGYPLTPEPTVSVHTSSPFTDLHGAIRRSVSEQLPKSISPQELQKPFKPDPIVTESSQLTPSQSSSCRSSEDGHAPPTAAMPCQQSPRVTVSMWGKDDEAPTHTIERAFEDSPTTVRGGYQAAGDLITSNAEPTSASTVRNSMGQWQRDPVTGHGGLGPDNRSSDTTASPNELAKQQELAKQAAKVDHWLADKMNDLSVDPLETSPDDISAFNQKRDVDDNIRLGDQTENQYQASQTYYGGPGGEMSQEDYDIIAMNHKWADAPMIHSIRQGGSRHQPQSSQAAIERFERMCRDTDSIVSRAATWGTRRRSLPSVMDFDVTNSGNFLKKLSISRGEKSSSLFRDLKGLVRKPSAASRLKRNRSSNGLDDESLHGSDSRGSQDSAKRDSVPHLAPPARMSSWGKSSKKQTPSINTALVSMGHNAASIGTTHARSGSISATPITSPKSPFGGLTVKGSLRRPRSKSDLPKTSPVVTTGDSHPTLVSMWKQSGGPPVASLAKTNIADADDDDDEDEDAYEDMDMKANANMIDEVAPNFAGFQEHVLKLNPGLAGPGAYLVDRIAHQQIIRYKQLLNSKVKHLGMGAGCPSGALCIALGGSASVLDQNGDSRGLDPLSTNFGDEDDGTATEGVITNESFPQDIPMPPTQRLPAEFECQLCYQSKKFQKPSDWTKHVHEDVQPFTCTWDKCRDPKIFKRKADWVRHENEGHRHLEWWTCDVDDCRHTCYRRDNFLQHLVREHKYLEPKVKTKAAMKRAGGIDPTWQKVEQCHVETTKRPQEEPCRFCGKQFPTWKKLTVHLAKHMEQISLPVLRLVAVKAKELDADTIISPVQDPPPRQMIPPPTTQTTPLMQYPAGVHQVSPNPPQVQFQTPSQLMYPVMPPPDQYQQQNFYHQPQYDSIGQSLEAPTMGMHHMNQGFDQSRQMQEIPVTSAPYMHAPNQYMMPSHQLEPFPQMNALGLQNHAMPMGAQMAYDGIIDPSSGHGSPFSGQGSASPYTHSPNLNAGNGDPIWNERKMAPYQ